MHNPHKDTTQEHPNSGQALIPARNFSLGQAKRDPYSPAGVDSSEGRGDFAVTLRQYIHILLKRKWLILSFALVLFVLGGVRALMKTPLYSATSRIQIDREAGKVIEGGSISPNEEGGTEFLRTQYELLKSRAMAERVVSSTRIKENKDILRPNEVSSLSVLSGSGKGPGVSSSALQDRAVATVMANVTISPVMQSRLVDLTYLDPNPSRAQQIANAYAEAYVASTLDKRFQANAYAKTFLEDQIKQLKIRLEESEKALLDFAEREKMMEVNEKSSIADNNLAAANVALGQLISERIKTEQLWKQHGSHNEMASPRSGARRFPFE